MIDVRIRDQDEPAAQHLTYLPIEQLDDGLKIVRGWGVRTDYDDAGNDVVGQFVIDETGAYFEIVVCR